eukprot:SAG11_NODE_6703_length_1263_cov_0.879725_1_plen_219_part_00
MALAHIGRRQVLLLLVFVTQLPGASAADKRYGVDTGMKLYGNQGKEEDEPRVRAAAAQIKCDVCKTLVVDLWNKTACVPKLLLPCSSWEFLLKRSTALLTALLCALLTALLCAPLMAAMLPAANRTRGIDDDKGESGRVVKTEDGVLSLIEDTCRGRAPLFTQQHEVREEGHELYSFHAAPDGPSDWPDGVPRPLLVMVCAPPAYIFTRSLCMSFCGL